MRVTTTSASFAPFSKAGSNRAGQAAQAPLFLLRQLLP